MKFNIKYNLIRRIALSLSVGALLLITHGLQAIEFNTLSIAKYTHTDRDVTFYSNQTASLKITLISPQVVRIWARSDSDFPRVDAAWRAGDNSSKIEYAVEDKGDYFAIKTDALTVRVFKSSMKVAFYSLDDKTVLNNDYGQGMVINEQSHEVLVNRALASSEHFYGLGQDNNAMLGAMDRRGRTRDMWTGQKINPGRVTADIPITFFMSTGTGGGYGIYFENSYHSTFDMGKSASDHYSFGAKGGELMYYFIYGPALPQVLQRYGDITGRPPMPPLWSLGYMQSKCTYFTWDEIDEVVASMRQKKIPLDVMVIDYDWPEQIQNYKWHSRWKGKSPEKIASYKKDGIRFLISNSGPMIKKESSNYQDGLKNHIFATDGHGNTVSCGHYGGDLMDFTAPNMKSWLWPQMSHLYDEGIAGWWLDLTEPEGEPEQTIYQGGPSAKIHNNYSLLMTKAYYEMQKSADPDSRPFILTRTGSAGIQKYGAAIWTGDIHSDYDTLQAHVPEALNAMMSGIPYWSNDSGGFLQGFYKNDPKAHGLLYERWLEFSVFTPITRAHHVGPSEPYKFGPNVEETARKYLTLRYRLLPYIYSYAFRTHETGLPMMRPLVLEYQNDPQVYDIRDEYLFGHEILVAPVLKEKMAARAVYFPKGTWIDYDFGYEFKGGKQYNVAAPQNRIPLYVRAGAIIPMAPPMQYTGEKSWDPMTFDIYPHKKSSFELYVDDGISMAYENEQKSTKTSITSNLTDRKVAITITEQNKNFAPHSYQLALHLTAVPTTVKYATSAIDLAKSKEDYDGLGKAAYWEVSSRTLYVKFNTNAPLVHTIIVDLSTTKVPRPLPPNIDLDNPPNDPNSGGGIEEMPHFYPPPTIPALIKAENYDNGGKEVAYHRKKPVTTPTTSQPYRTDDAGIISTTENGGGYALDTIMADEWFKYTFIVPTSGYYDVTARVSADLDGSSFSLASDDQDFTGRIAVSTATTEGTYQNVMIPGRYLRAGQNILRYNTLSGGIKLRNIDFKASAVQVTIDELDDFSKTSSHSPNLGFDTTNTNYFKGDPSRLNKSDTGEGTFTYTLTGGTHKVLVYSHHWPGEPLKSLTFAGSTDGTTWTKIDAKVQNNGGDWVSITWELNDIEAYRSLKIILPKTDTNWTLEIGRIEFWAL